MMDSNQCRAINVGFEWDVDIESKLSISIIGFDFDMAKILSFPFQYRHIFNSIPIVHSGPHLNLPAISTGLNWVFMIFDFSKRLLQHQDTSYYGKVLL